MPNRENFSLAELEMADRAAISIWLILGRIWAIRILIVDNASWPRSKSLNWGNFEPIFLPPYFPDLNPIERLWLLMKGERLSDFFAKCSDDLVNRICDALNCVTKRKIQKQTTCVISTELKVTAIRLPKTRWGKLLRRVLRAQEHGLPSGDPLKLMDWTCWSKPCLPTRSYNETQGYKKQAVNQSVGKNG